MNVYAIARNDFLNARRSKLLWGVCGLYAVFTALLFYAGSTAPQPDANQQLWGMLGIGFIFIPLVALVSAYLSIAGERESGTITFRLGLPNRRWEVVVGKFLSRAFLVTVGIVLAVVVAAAISIALYPDPDLSNFPGFTALTALLTVAFVAIAVGISASVASRSRAIGLVMGYYFAFDLLWVFGSFSIVGALQFLLEDTLGLSLHETFYQFVQALSPVGAYLRATRLVFDAEAFAQLPDEPPSEWFLQPEAMLVLLVAWIVVPLAFGVWRFRRADLG